MKRFLTNKKKYIGNIVFVEVKKKRGIQVFDGILKSIRKRGLGSSFKIKRNKNGEKVYFRFKLFSPNIISIKFKNIYLPNLDLNQGHTD